MTCTMSPKRKLRGLADCSQQTLSSGISGATEQTEKNQRELSAKREESEGEIEGKREKIARARRCGNNSVYFALYDSLNTGLKARAHM